MTTTDPVEPLAACACGCGCEPDGDWHWSQQPWCPCVRQGCPCVVDVRQSAEIGDRVRLWIGPPVKGGYQYGEVIGIDNGSRPGIEIRFDRSVLGQPTCYATHNEVEVVLPPASTDGSDR